MTIQLELESAIHQLADEFLQAPYRFFTEADAVSRCHQLLDSAPTISRKVATQDGYEIGLAHREYPTFFRFADDNPVERLNDDSRARRGHYDIVILRPEFITTHCAETVKNRNIKAIRDQSIMPFEAIIEFKLDDRGWSSHRARGAVTELGKLDLSANEASLRYLVVLMRYTAPNPHRWEQYWPLVSQAANAKPEIGSIFAINWLTVKGSCQTYHFGRWSNEQRM